MDELRTVREMLAASEWKDGDLVPAFEDDYPEVVASLPESFDDDLISKPACQRQWRWDQQHGLWGGTCHEALDRRHAFDERFMAGAYAG